MYGTTLRGLGVALALSLACQGDDEQDDTGAVEEPGHELWRRSLPAQALAIAVGYDSSIAATGVKGDSLWVGRFADDGDELWSRTEPGYQGLSVAADPFETYVAAKPNDGAPGGRVLALDSDGSVLWTLDDAEREPRALASAPGGGVYAVGLVEDSPSIFIERILPSGDVQWVIEEDEVFGTTLDADSASDGVVVVTGSRDDGSWWVHARSSLGDPLWTTELGQLVGPALPRVSRGGAWIHASVLTQGEGSRGSVVELERTGEVRWIQPVDAPPTDIASSGSQYGPLLLSILVDPSINALGNGGAIEWSVEQDPDCPKTYAVVRRSAADAVALRSCTAGGSQLVVFQVS
ncbi:MAG: hypothetical protein R3A79_00010 [Nannocystaceae bacterium]